MNDDILDPPSHLSRRSRATSESGRRRLKVCRLRELVLLSRAELKSTRAGNQTWRNTEKLRSVSSVPTVGPALGA